MSPREDPVRTLVVTVPDWSVIAAGVSAIDPAAVLRANRVIATSPAARDEGVEVGQRRREAQRRCPSLVIIDSDVDRDARAFAAVVGVLDRFTPRIELSRPGHIAFPTVGPSRYFGGDDALAGFIAEAIDVVLTDMGWPVAAGVGIADGPFAASRAAVMALRDPAATCVVPEGGAPAFLAPFPISVLDRPELTDVLIRLGVRTLGAFAELTVDDVTARFGMQGRDAHRLARGVDGHAPDVGPPPKHFDVSIDLDPPAERVDIAAFAARTLADGLHERLSAEGLACTRIAIGAETEHGEHLERVWRHEGALSAAAIADRVRWQLDGWLNGPPSIRPTSGVVRIVLTPDEVMAARGRQQGFWGGETAADERADRALARVQGMLGAAAVTVPEIRGGRSPADRVVRTAFTGVDDDRSAVRSRAEAPWPGRIPDPMPTLLPVTPVEVSVLDHAGRPVTVSGRGAISAEPMHVAIGEGRNGSRFSVMSWAGPWIADERWWDPEARRRRARLQLVLDDGRGVLVSVEHGTWSLEGIHD